MRTHKVSTTTRVAGGFWNGLRPIEHEGNGPTRYRVMVLTSWVRTVPVSCQDSSFVLQS